MAPFKGDLSNLLNEWFECDGIPNAQMISPEGNLMTDSACGFIRGGDVSGFPWEMKHSPCGFLGSSCPLDPINTVPCIMLFQNDESKDDCQKIIDTVFPPIAQKDYQLTRKEPMKV